MSSSLAGRANPSLPSGLAAAIARAQPGLLERVAPSLAVPAWATVDLDRATVELGDTVEVGATVELGAAVASEAPPADEILGARARLAELRGGGRLVLLEPSTEGRLAGALARHGEGWVAVYLIVPAGPLAGLRRSGTAVTARAPGPFGPERLVLGGPRDGPFVLLVSEVAPPAAGP